jgi:hypothetical protein
MKRHETDNLDKLLSSRLMKAIGEDGRADWLDVSKRAGMNRAIWHWSRRRVLVVAGVFVLVVGACAGSTGVIPWRVTKPGPFSVEVLPICKADVVKAKVFLKRRPGAGRSVGGVIVLANTGKPNCALSGQPKVSLVGSSAHSARWRILLPASVFSPKRIGNPRQTAIGRASRPSGENTGIQSDQISGVFFSWDNWCGPGSGTNGYAGKPSLRFEIPNGSAFVLPVYRLPGCTRPGGWSTLRFDSQGAIGASLREPDPPIRAEILGQRKGHRLVIHSGKVFHYRVALTNTSARSFRFRTCPMFGEEVFDSEGVIAYGGFYEPSITGPSFYILNCRSVKEIKAGETVTYAMEMPIGKDVLTPIMKKYRALVKTGLPVPKNALDGTTLGNGKLVWDLVVGWDHRPTAEAPVKVVP